MKIRMKQCAAGMGFMYRPGQVVDHLPNEEAQTWCAMGIAERQLEVPVEAATVAAPQNAAIRRRRARVQPPRA